MAIIACPTCGGRMPASAITCVHCGALAPVCRKCSGSGVCPRCKNVYPKVAGCSRCKQTGRCPECEGRQRSWPGAKSAGPRS